jgi:hypothetical protein
MEQELEKPEIEIDLEDNKPEEKKLTKAEMKKQKIKEIKEKEKSLIDSWKGSLQSEEIIQDKVFFQMKHYISMVAKGFSFGTIIQSRAGTGKTYTTRTLLEKEGIDYAYLESYSTPAAFYIWLYKNKDRIKVIDDVHKILESDKFTPYLKALLWDFNGKRIVRYNSTKPLKDEEGDYIERVFEETGGTIILTNKMNPENPHIAAVASRVNVLNLEVTNEQMIQIMRKIIEKPYKGMTHEQRKEVFDFIESNWRASKELNCRTLIKGYQYYLYSQTTDIKDEWKRLLADELEYDEELLMIEELMKKDMDTEEQVNEYIKLTGKSRATFFRLKKKYVIESQVSEQDDLEEEKSQVSEANPKKEVATVG